VAIRLLLLTTSGLVACGGPPRLDRTPDAVELERLTSLAGAPPRQAWSTRGHARLSSPDGTVEGNLQAVVDLPERLRVELRSRALFGMVGERLVLSLPGDGHLLMYRARADALERSPFADSELARYLPTGSLAELHALVTGRPPWPQGRPPEDLAARTRLVGRSEDGRNLEFRVQLSSPQAVFELRLRDGVLEQWGWEGAEGRRLVVRYDRWRRWGELELPGRLRLQAPREGMEGEILLEAIEARDGLAAADFEVY